MDLNGAVVIVTGAARGIGKVIAQTFAGRGAKLALADLLEEPLRETAGELEKAGATTLAIPTDVTSPEAVGAMAAQVERELGPADVLVNVAGTFSVIAPVWEVEDPERWFRDCRVNLFGTFLCCRAVVKGMVERGRGYVLNMVGGGVGDPHAYSTSYATSKAATMRLTEGLAKEAAPHGVKVFAMQPGAVLSEMTKFIMDSSGGKKWRPGFKDIFEKGRGTSPQLVADLALNLVSGKADRLTGRYFEVRMDFDKLVQDTDRILKEDLNTLRLRT